MFIGCVIPRLEVLLEHFAERLLSRHAGTHHGSDFV